MAGDDDPASRPAPTTDYWEDRGKLDGILSVEPFSVEADRTREERFRRKLLVWTERLMRRAGALPAAHLLDLGCGFGDVSSHLAPHARRITAVDGARTMIEQATARLAATGHGDWRALHGDLVRFDAIAPDVDVVYLGAVCMYLSDDEYRALLARIATRAAAGACVVQRDYVAMNRGWTGVTERGNYRSYRRSVDDYVALAAREGFACELRRYSSDMDIDVALAAVTFDSAIGRGLAAAIRPLGRLVRATKKAGSATFILRHRGAIPAQEP